MRAYLKFLGWLTVIVVAALAVWYGGRWLWHHPGPKAPLGPWFWGVLAGYWLLSMLVDKIAQPLKDIAYELYRLREERENTRRAYELVAQERALWAKQQRGTQA